MWLQHMTRSFGSAGLRDSMMGDSPKKEGGELILSNGIKMPYSDTESCILAAKAVKKFEKKALYDEQQEGKLKGYLRDTVKKNGPPKEWHSFTLNFSKEEVETMKPEHIEAAREALKKTIEEVAKDNGGKVSYFLDHVHYDRKDKKTGGAHIQARVHKIPVDFENKNIGKTLDLITASSASNFADKFKHNFAELVEIEPDNLNRIVFYAPSGAEVDVKNARKGNLSKSPEEYQEWKEKNNVAEFKKEEAEATIKTDIPFNIELARIANLENESDKQVKSIEAQIRQLERQKEKAVTVLEDTRHARKAIEEKEEVLQEKAEVQKELKGVKGDLEYSNTQLKNKNVEIAHNESKIEKLNEFLTTEKQNTAELETTVEKFSDKNNELFAEVENQKEKVAESKKAAGLLKDELKDSVKHVTKLSSEISINKADLKEVKSENEDLVKDIEGKEKEVDIQKKSIDSLVTQNSELSKDLESVEKDKDDLRNDKQDLKNDNSSLKSENTKLNQKNGELENDLKGLAQQIQEMQAKMFEILEGQNKTLAENSALVEQVQQLLAKMDSLSVTQTTEKDSDDKSQFVEALKNFDEPEKPEVQQELTAAEEADIMKVRDDIQTKADKEKSDSDKSKNKDNDNENDR